MGYKIKELRVEMGLTQAELASASQVSRSIISGLESGSVKTTTTNTLKKIAKVLNRPVNEIFFAD